jgi:hypothetical protein
MCIAQWQRGQKLLTNCQLDLRLTSGGCREGPRGVGGPPACPPSRTCQRLSEHRVALTDVKGMTMQGVAAK